ncbi:MAG: OmpH family outer membrane protein [Betaproteobacteria bacterium]
MASASFAQEFKIGIVNLDRIVRESGPAKTAQTKLESEFAKREKEINDLGNQIKTLSDRLEREAPTLSESQRAARQKQLMDQDRDFQRKRREFQEDLNNRKNEELQAIIDRANRAVRTLAENEKFDLIIQEAVYIHPKHDITDKVIKLLNASGSR